MGCGDLTGRFVIQCKFTIRINHVLRPSDLPDDEGVTEPQTDRPKNLR